jgi:lipoprotein-anchoring transpeptidase ErfK/SrfK
MTQTERYLIRVAVTAMIVTAEALSEERRISGRRIVVNIPDRRLMLIEGGEVVKTYAVAVGTPATPTPSGTFQVVTRVTNPAWYRPGKVVPPGPSNRLGPRWIGLSRKGYGIHGTDSPRSIGRAKSHGCVRMRNADVEELFELVQVGDVVELQTEHVEGGGE